MIMNTNTTLSAPAEKTIFSQPTHEMPGGGLLPKDENYRTIESSDYLGSAGFSITGLISAADADLICRAFNEHAALDEVADAAKFLIDNWGNLAYSVWAGMKLRDSLSKLAAIRNQK